jgi:hypothetical protein
MTEQAPRQIFDWNREEWVDVAADDFRIGTRPVPKVDHQTETAKLVLQLEAIVHDSGSPPAGFDVAAWIARWVEAPCPALGGVRPVEVLHTAEGCSRVSGVLAQMQSGAYA